MIKRRRIAVLGVLAAVAASIFVLPASSASAADQTYTNACRNSAVGTNWDQVNVTMGATSPATVAPNGSITLSGIHQTLAVPGAIFVAGYNLGLLTVGQNTIPADLHSIIDAANTTELSQSTNTVTTTLTTTITDPDGTPGSGDETASDASSSVNFNDQTWTAGPTAGPTINFAEHNDPAVTGVAGGGIIAIASLAGGFIHVQFHCTSGTVAGSNPGVPTFTNAPTLTSTVIDAGGPTANAGPDQPNVTSGNTVTLDGSGSTDPDLPNDTLTYAWTQTAGPTVTLTGANTSSPTFTAPNVASPTDLTFQLQVCDQASQCSTDTVTITVSPAVVPPSNITINDVSMNEGNSGTTAFNFTVSLSAAQAAPVTVDFATADGTATAPTDYTATSGTATFAPGVTTQTVTVLVNGDTTFEPNETFFVNLSNATGNATITDNQGQGTIVNDDAAPPVIDASGQVIVNGPVSHTKTSKSFVFKVCNLGNAPITVNPTDVTSSVDVNGTTTGTVSVSGLPVTIGPGSCKRLKAVWSYDSSLTGGETVVFNASVNVTGDTTTTNNSSSATVTAK